MTLLGTDPTAGGATAAQRWAALVTHRESVVRLARRRGAGADAEDVAQEALLRAASHPGLDLARAYSYLAKVASNLVIDMHRRSAREQQLRTHAGLIPRPCPSDEDVEERDLARHAARLVSNLPPDLRSILFLRRDGATWSQVGAQLGQRPTTAEMRYRRAMLPLRRQLGAGPTGAPKFSVEPAFRPRSTDSKRSGGTAPGHRPKWKEVPWTRT
jgi:RNA polymerase sigma-70 factor (ECF subfamily)